MENSIYISFTEYLQQELNGAIVNSDDIEKLRKAYRKQYLKEYHRKRRATNEHRLTVRLSKKDYKRIKNLSESHSLSMSSFIGKTVLAYCEKGYVPRDMESIRTLTKQILKVANNINQLVKKNHIAVKTRSELDHTDDYNQLVQQVLELRVLVIEKMKSPPIDLKKALIEFVEQHDPEKRKELANFILNA